MLGHSGLGDKQDLRGSRKTLLPHHFTEDKQGIDGIVQAASFLHLFITLSYLNIKTNELTRGGIKKIMPLK
jgi:hypothetical protein